MQMLTIGETARLYRSSRRTIERRIADRRSDSSHRQLKIFPSSSNARFVRLPKCTWKFLACQRQRVTAAAPAAQVPPRHAVTSIPPFFADTVRTPISRVYHYERAQ